MPKSYQTKDGGKIGSKVTYSFSEKAINKQYILAVIRATKAQFSDQYKFEKIAELNIFPTTSTESKIERVILFNKGAKDVNKASYADTLVARAYCIGMVNKEIEFQLWEDDAKGKGHDTVTNKNNSNDQLKFKATVNQKGIAETKIPLSSNPKVLQNIANKYLMAGDKTEGANHEYYVTASYLGEIKGASQVNVDVANPDYKKSQNEPKKDSAVFPVNKGTKKSDTKNKIKNAYFVNDKNEILKKIIIGRTIKVQLITEGLVGKHIQYIIWEKDGSMFHDEIFKSERIKIPSNICTTGGFTVTKELFEKGIDLSILDVDPDAEKQNYFIEVIPLDVETESKRFGIDSDIGLLEVEKTKSVAVVAKQPEQKREEKEKLVIFPLLVKPENDDKNKWGKSRNWASKQGDNMTTFNSNRDKGKRKHAGRDLYTNPYEIVVAIADGEVLDVRSFYSETDQVTIRHTLKDGRDFIIRYGELDPSSIKVKKGDTIKQKKEIGKTGKLLKFLSKTKEYVPLMKIGDETVFMIHFEHFNGNLGFNLNNNPLSDSSKPYNRRSDLLDSLAILQEGYNNTFGVQAKSNENNEETGFTEHHARKALLYIYNQYGKDIAIIVEKMYRLETSHFKSEQYKHCGTGGMESFGSAPYYGWDSTTFIKHPEHTPIGTWSAYEGKGLSDDGGNKQVTNKQKTFVKLPSVLAGMEYKAEYIVRYNGNYARWFNSSDLKAQEAYKESLKGIKSRIVDSFKNEK